MHCRQARRSRLQCSKISPAGLCARRSTRSCWLGTNRSLGLAKVIQFQEQPSNFSLSPPLQEQPGLFWSSGAPPAGA